jgi:hypothetical protein
MKNYHFIVNFAILAYVPRIILQFKLLSILLSKPLLNVRILFPWLKLTCQNNENAAIINQENGLMQRLAGTSK